MVRACAAGATPCTEREDGVVASTSLLSILFGEVRVVMVMVDVMVVTVYTCYMHVYTMHMHMRCCCAFMYLHIPSDIT